jgi:beta-galactosidase
VYSNGDEAELFLNGNSLGRRKKIDPDQVRTSMSLRGSLDYRIGMGDDRNPYFEIVDAYRLRWLEVPYEPGELKAVAYKNGEMIGEAVVKTAGKPYRIELKPDRTRLIADGMDLCYFAIEMVDSEGIVCPLAMDMLEFSVEGAARLMGVANGNQLGHDVFTDATHPLFYGKAVAVLRSVPRQSGEAVLTVKSESGMETSSKVIFE